MIKYIFTLLNMLVLFIYQAFLSDGVTATQQVPANVKPGEEFVVTVTIKKGDLGGFAKLQQTLPEGFTAKEVETKGASFTFLDQTAKFIWTALPNEPEFTVSYKIKVADNATGTKQLSGKFAYVLNNVKNIAEIAPANIVIGDGVAVVAQQESSQQESKTEEPVSAAPQSESNSAAVSATSTTSAGAYQVTRTIAPIAGGDYQVDLTLTKGQLEGFAKLQDKIPAGYNVTAMATEGASFTFTEQTAKFVWLALPAQNQLKISYRLVPQANAAKNATIDGLFSYIENDVTQKVTINSTAIPTSTNDALAVAPEPKQEAIKTDLASNTETKEVETETPVSAQEVATQEESANQPEVQAIKTTTTQTNNTTPQVPASSSNVNYRVQVAALTKNIEPTELASKLKLSESLYNDPHQGLNKYTFGNYTEYVQARDARDQVKSKVKGAFVTAYNGGNRITVQEAIMITKQKWFR